MLHLKCIPLDDQSEERSVKLRVRQKSTVHVLYVVAQCVVVMQLHIYFRSDLDTLFLYCHHMATGLLFGFLTTPNWR